jgi:magnesium chelatase family protein
VYGRVTGVAILGVRGRPIVVEAYVGRGLPSLTLTGLPGAAVQDARDRVKPAVESAGLTWPLRRVVVNLAPGNVRKEGPGLDLAVATSVLVATGQLAQDRLEGWAFAGELSLRGALVSTPGILSVAIAAVRSGCRGVVVPAANGAEAALVDGLEVVAASSLEDVAGFFRGTWHPPLVEPPPREDHATAAAGVDLADVRGQAQARRALEIAAAGGHNLCLLGSPGAGKTMLARRLPTILPEMSHEEALEVTQLHSVAGILSGGGLVRERPFRAPHHSVSIPGLLGGGSGALRPGEVSLAHHGVLFLDELTEFRRDALEGLRQPLEDGQVVVTRVVGSAAFPARFTLVAAANPCPCGYLGDARRACTCRADRAEMYRAKLSGPLIDRIDLRVHVPRLTKGELLGQVAGEASSAVRDRVEAARDRQRVRLRHLGLHCNAQLPGPIARRETNATSDAEAILGAAVEQHALSGRGFDRALKVARTIADLAGSDAVCSDHVVEALAYRATDSDAELAGAG